MQIWINIYCILLSVAYISPRSFYELTQFWVNTYFKNCRRRAFPLIIGFGLPDTLLHNWATKSRSSHLLTQFHLTRYYVVLLRDFPESLSLTQWTQFIEPLILIKQHCHKPLEILEVTDNMHIIQTQTESFHFLMQFWVKRCFILGK